MLFFCMRKGIFAAPFSEFCSFSCFLEDGSGAALILAAALSAPLRPYWPCGLVLR
jgi:hypothetical protein